MPPHERWKSKFQIKQSTWVFVPTEETIDRGLQIKKLIEDRWHIPGHFYHLKSGGHIRALRKHQKNQYFIHLDIQNFFGQINRSRITRNLKGLMSYQHARDIAVESTVRLPESETKKYILPFGFVQSPIIASVCLSMSALGRYLSKLESTKDFTVTIYMDDILVSGNDPEQLTHQMKLIKAAADKSGFPLNIEKQEGPTSCVTAFNIELSQDLLKVATKKLQQLTNLYAVSTNEHQCAGILSYVLSVNEAQANRLKKN